LKDLKSGCELSLRITKNKYHCKSCNWKVRTPKKLNYCPRCKKSYNNNIEILRSKYIDYINIGDQVVWVTEQSLDVLERYVDAVIEMRRKENVDIK
jgi:hypothetical protein